MISKSILVASTVAAFLGGILYTRITTAHARSDHQRTKKQLELTLANRDALKLVSQSYRTNLKTFEGIRFEVEVGLRARIDTLKDQLDAIEESMIRSDPSESEDDESWLLENVKNVPIKLRPEHIIEPEEDSRVILSFQDELCILASHSVVNNLSAQVFIQAIEDILNTHELVRKNVLKTVFCAILSKTHPTDQDAIIRFWDHYRMVFSFFIEDQDCLVVFGDALKSTVDASLVRLHYELLFNDPDTHHSVSSRSSLQSYQPLSESQCREKSKLKTRRVSFHPDTRTEVSPLDQHIERELCIEHAIIFATIDSESDYDESELVDTEVYRINREISLGIVAQGKPPTAPVSESSGSELTFGIGTTFSETDWFDQRGVVADDSDENVFNVTRDSHAKRRSLKKKRC